MDCIFCKIIAKEIPADMIYENEKVVAILDINPVNPGHALVIPKAHSINTAVADNADLVAMALAVKKIAPAVCAATASDSWNLLAIGELVAHTHWHIIPRHKNDGLKYWPTHPYAADEAAKIAALIRANLS